MELCFNVRTFFHECKLVYTMDFKVTPHMLRHMAKRRKEKHGKCVDCPYQGTGMCR